MTHLCYTQKKNCFGRGRVMNTFLAITYSFLLGFCPAEDIGMGNNIEYYDNATHVRFELGLDLFDMVRVYTGEETLQIAEPNIFRWMPYTQAYIIGAEYHKEFDEKLSLKAGVSHRCQHPMNAWGVQKSNFNCARTEIYVKVSGKLDIF